MLTDAERMHGECMEDAWRTAVHIPGARQLKANRTTPEKRRNSTVFVTYI